MDVIRDDVHILSDPLRKRVGNRRRVLALDINQFPEAYVNCSRVLQKGMSGPAISGIVNDWQNLCICSDGKFCSSPRKWFQLARRATRSLWENYYGQTLLKTLLALRQ